MAWGESADSFSVDRLQPDNPADRVNAVVPYKKERRETTISSPTSGSSGVLEASKSSPFTLAISPRFYVCYLHL